MFFLQSVIIHPHTCTFKAWGFDAAATHLIKNLQASAPPNAMSSICRSCKATHVTDFLSSPVELFGTRVQVGRSTPSATIDAHVQHRGMKCACAPLHNVARVLPPTGELCVGIRISNLKETADPGSHIRISLPAMRGCVCVQLIFIHGHMGICAPS